MFIKFKITFGSFSWTSRLSPWISDGFLLNVYRRPLKHRFCRQQIRILQSSLHSPLFISLDQFVACLIQVWSLIDYVSNSSFCEANQKFNGIFSSNNRVSLGAGKYRTITILSLIFRKIFSILETIILVTNITPCSTWYKAGGVRNQGHGCKFVLYLWQFKLH